MVLNEWGVRNRNKVGGIKTLILYQRPQSSLLRKADTGPECSPDTEKSITKRFISLFAYLHCHSWEPAPLQESPAPLTQPTPRTYRGDWVLNKQCPGLISQPHRLSQFIYLAKTELEDSAHETSLPLCKHGQPGHWSLSKCANMRVPHCVPRGSGTQLATKQTREVLRVPPQAPTGAWKVPGAESRQLPLAQGLISGLTWDGSGALAHMNSPPGQSPGWLWWKCLESAARDKDQGKKIGWVHCQYHPTQVNSPLPHHPHHQAVAWKEKHCYPHHLPSLQAQYLIISSRWLHKCCTPGCCQLLPLNSLDLPRSKFRTWKWRMAVGPMFSEKSLQKLDFLWLISFQGLGEDLGKKKIQENKA